MFDNDIPALLPFVQGYSPVNEEDLEFRKNQASKTCASEDEKFKRLLIEEPEFGLCMVVCFSPRHDLTLPDFKNEQIENVVQTWTDQTRNLAKHNLTRYIQIFKNKGEMMGASNSHTHGQIWATNHISNELLKEGLSQLQHLTQNKTCLLCDYLSVENKFVDRIVTKNKYFTAMVPFWAVWSFEIILIVNRHLPSFVDLNQAEIKGLAEIIRSVTTRYDNPFRTPFPYSKGFHRAPVNIGEHPEWYFLPIIIHPCCVLPPSENLWSVLKCLLLPRGISPKKMLRSSYVS